MNAKGNKGVAFKVNTLAFIRNLLVNSLHHYGVILFVILGLFMSACERRYRPNANTEEHKLAHGHVDGKTNQILVGRTLLRIPPSIKYKPVTAGKIHPGQADQVFLGISFPQYVKNDNINSVLIMLRKGYEDPKIWNKYFDDKVWKKIDENIELGLTEYHQDVNHMAWGYIVYAPIEKEFKTPKGSIVKYSCSGNGRGVTYCLSGFVLGDDLYVQYKISRQLLPYWKEVHLSVISYVNNLISDQGE
ncbi:hypothetical protein Mag101_05635 [Microbulbifer agarilyticus]|uniref:Uncharacterized protein n=1 Tax=Microbulbifer agarilyticus TaxID=260552 RepID=A0A1Q2M364_9GAMM|nr:hypothetical protein [Microbulbifer agarilyticus]AQQ67175.1 hypothetical protein Mag101_05635 [Microbulbifer agarilyticus]